MSEPWLVRIRFDPAGEIELRQDFQWYEVDGPPADLYARHANLLIPFDYEYSPYQGQPGALLASRVMSELGGVAEFPEFPPAPSGTVY